MKLQQNTIYKGDTVSVLKTIEDNTFDMIFADPPYFMQTDGVLLRPNGAKFDGVDDKWDKFNDFEEYDTFSKNWLSECRRVLKPNGTIWVIGSFQNIYRIGYIMQNLNFWILNDIIWNKTNPVPNFAGTRFCNAHETLLWASKSKDSHYCFNYKTMKALNNGKQDKSIWTIPLCTGTERLKDETGHKLHSTQKPEELLYKVIVSSSKLGDLILDPFFGTGTTGAVARHCGRNFIGIEREEKYIKAAIERIKHQPVSIDEFSNGSLEVMPPRVSMKTLLEHGYISVGQELYNWKNIPLCVVTADGMVKDQTETLSIHKMAAKILNKSSFNGWTFFHVIRNRQLTLLDKLRYIYAKEH